MLHMSTAGPYGLWRSTSGAVYPGVPSEVVSSPLRMEEEKPKSVSLMEARSVPLQVTLRKKTHSTNRMFCGFRSRWTMPCAWQYCTADTRQRVICCASDSVNCCRCLM